QYGSARLASWGDRGLSFPILPRSQPLYFCSTSRQKPVKELIRPEVRLMLRQGSRCAHAPSAGTCSAILELEEGPPSRPEVYGCTQGACTDERRKSQLRNAVETRSCPIWRCRE